MRPNGWRKSFTISYLYGGYIIQGVYMRQETMSIRKLEI